MYIIDITSLFPNYCSKTTEDFEGVQTKLYQIGEYLRLTVILFNKETPYFLLSRKDNRPVERLSYFFLLEYWSTIFQDIHLPENVDQFYNEETGVLHVRERVRRVTDCETGWND